MVELAGKFDGLTSGAPQGSQQADLLVDPPAAPVPWHAHGYGLLPEPANSNAIENAAPGVEIDAGQLPGVENGIPDRENGNARAKLDPLRHRRRDGKGGVHLQVHSHGCLHVGKCKALRRGGQDVLGFKMGWDHHVIGRPNRIEPGGFSRSAEVDHECRGRERSKVGDADA